MRRFATSISRAHPPTPSALCTVPAVREARVVKRSGYTRARHRHFIFLVPNYQTEFLTFFSLSFQPFISCELPASRLLLRARFCTFRRTSAVLCICYLENDKLEDIDRKCVFRIKYALLRNAAHMPK
jgi:hypothetical protein